MYIDKAVKVLKSGGIAVLPTDTIYGIHCKADLPEVVEKVNQLKGRDEGKKFIVLISQIDDLNQFGVNLNQEDRHILEKIWPGAVSVILDGQAFRMPDYQVIKQILEQTGPLISTSCNLSGQPSANNIQKAREYFGDKIDLYLDAGELNNPPSTLIKLTDGQIEVLRQGAVSF